MDGLYLSPGDGWVTSAPNIMVRVAAMNGTSAASKYEFIPLSFKFIFKQTFAQYCLLGSLMCVAYRHCVGIPITVSATLLMLAYRGKPASGRMHRKSWGFAFAKFPAVIHISFKLGVTS